jgi:hypothetical protein
MAGVAPPQVVPGEHPGGGLVAYASE